MTSKTNRKAYVIIAVVIACVAGLFLFAQSGKDDKESAKVQSKPMKTPRDVSGSPTAFKVAKAKDIVITEPTQGATIKSGDMASGTALVQGDSVQIRLKSASRGMLLDAPATLSGAPGKPRRFELPIDFQREAVPGDGASLEVAGTSIDGRPISTIITVTVK